MGNPMWKGGLPPSLAAGQYNASAPTLTDGEQTVLQFDANGNLKNAIPDGALATLGSKTDGSWNGLAASTSAIAILERIASLLNQPQAVQFLKPQAVQRDIYEIDIPTGLSAVGYAIPYSIDCAHFAACALELTGTFNLTLLIRGSNTGFGFGFTAYSPTNLNTGTSAQALTAPGLYWCNLKARYTQLYCSVFTSNTSLAGRITFFTQPFGS